MPEEQTKPGGRRPYKNNIPASIFRVWAFHFGPLPPTARRYGILLWLRCLLSATSYLPPGFLEPYHWQVSFIARPLKRNISTEVPWERTGQGKCLDQSCRWLSVLLFPLSDGPFSSKHLSLIQIDGLSIYLCDLTLHLSPHQQWDPSCSCISFFTVRTLFDLCLYIVKGQGLMLGF